MTPERMAALVARWVRVYTRDLPPPIAARRIEEIEADLHDHVAHERAGGIADRRLALGIATRMVRGLPADASWRRHTIARLSTPKEVMRMRSRSAVRVALVTVLVLLVPFVWMQFDEDVNWSVPDFVMAGVLLAGSGLLLELAVRKPSSVVYRVAVAAIGVAAMLLGEEDDAPGLVLFGLLLFLGTIALAFRTAAQRSR